MRFFVIADVHGCLHTLRELLTHWHPATEQLVQLGDLVDRGNYSPETVELCCQLSQDFPEKTVFLQGNHDWAMAEHVGPRGPYKSWLGWGGRMTLTHYRRFPALLAAHAAWLAERPLFYETEHLLFSHAGFADVPAPTDPTNSEGVLWRRDALHNRGKRQVVGHTPTPTHAPVLDEASNTIYLDTGAVFGHNLTALRLSQFGEVLETIAVPVKLQDIKPAYKAG